MKYIKK